MQPQLEYQASLKNKKQVNTEQSDECKSRMAPLNKDPMSKVNLFSKKEEKEQVTNNPSSQIRKIVSGSRKLVSSYGLVDISTPKRVSHASKKRVTEEKLMPLEEIIAEVRALVLRARQANIQKKDRVAATKKERKSHRLLIGATIKSTSVKKEQTATPKVDSSSKQIQLRCEQNKKVPENSHATRTPISSNREKNGKVVEENTTFSLEEDSDNSKLVEINKPLEVVSGSKKECYVKKEHIAPHTPEGALDTFKAFFEKGKKEAVRQEKRVVTRVSSLIKNGCSESGHFEISDPPVTRPKDNATSFAGKEQISVPKNKSCMERFKSFFEKNEEDQVTKKTPSPMGEAFSKFKGLVVSNPPVIVNHIKPASSVEKEVGKKSGDDSGTKDERCMKKFKSLFKLGEKEQINTSSVPSVEKEDVEAKDGKCMAKFKSLFKLEKKEPIIQEAQVTASYCKSNMEKFKAFFKISEKESPKLEEPRQKKNKEKNATLNETKSFFNTENGMVSVSPPIVPDRVKQYGQAQQPQHQGLKKEKESKNVQEGSQQPQNPPESYSGIVGNIKKKICEISQGQKEPSERQQDYTVKYGTPKDQERMDSKVTNELNYVLDEGHNEAGGVDPHYVPIEDSTYNSSLFDNTDYILKTIIAKIVKN